MDNFFTSFKKDFENGNVSDSRIIGLARNFTFPIVYENKSIVESVNSFNEFLATLIKEQFGYDVHRNNFKDGSNFSDHINLADYFARFKEQMSFALTSDKYYRFRILIKDWNSFKFITKNLNAHNMVCYNITPIIERGQETEYKLVLWISIPIRYVVTFMQMFRPFQIVPLNHFDDFEAKMDYLTVDFNECLDIDLYNIQEGYQILIPEGYDDKYEGTFTLTDLVWKRRKIYEDSLLSDKEALEQLKKELSDKGKGKKAEAEKAVSVASNTPKVLVYNKDYLKDGLTSMTEAEAVILTKYCNGFDIITVEKFIELFNRGDFALNGKAIYLK